MFNQKLYDQYVEEHGLSRTETRKLVIDRSQIRFDLPVLDRSKYSKDELDRRTQEKQHKHDKQLINLLNFCVANENASIIDFDCRHYFGVMCGERSGASQRTDNSMEGDGPYLYGKFFFDHTEAWLLNGMIVRNAKYRRRANLFLTSHIYSVNENNIENQLHDAALGRGGIGSDISLNGISFIILPKRYSWYLPDGAHLVILGRRDILDNVNIPEHWIDNLECKEIPVLYGKSYL